MTRPILRRTGRRLSALLTMASIMFVSLLALPAAAVEGAETAAQGFGAGLWDGLILAGIAGTVMAIVAFAMSDPGDIHRADDHH